MEVLGKFFFNSLKVEIFKPDSNSGGISYTEYSLSLFSKTLMQQTLKQPLDLALSLPRLRPEPLVARDDLGEVVFAQSFHSSSTHSALIMSADITSPFSSLYKYLSVNLKGKTIPALA